MNFVHPEFLWLLLLLPLLALWRGRKGTAPALKYSSAELVRRIAKPRKFSPGGLLTSLRLFTLGLLIVALARPQAGLGHVEIESSGIDIVLAVDISTSMEALDFKLAGDTVSRLEVVKRVVSRFVEARTSDRIGVVVFAGRAYMVSPLTLDHDWLTGNLQRIQTGLIEDGTAIGSGIAAAVNRLRDQKSKSKIIILLTDGVNNAGRIQPAAAAETAKTLGIKIYTVAAGTEGEVPMPMKDRFGNTHIVRFNAGLDEETLKKVADITGGRFYRATDTEALQEVYDEIDKLEKTEASTKYQRYKELFHWLLVPGLALLGLEATLSATRYRRLP
jgi:Ca-activated chloride channel homolog